MLRHIRMSSKADAQRLPSLLAVTLSEWVRPLYSLRVPHRTPRLGEPDPICACRYPLFTLCTPQPSPYDADGSAQRNTPAVTECQPSDAVQPQIRIRPAIRLQKLWRGRASPGVYQHNIFPNRPACYRCDICDGFQDVRDETEGVEDLRERKLTHIAAVATAAMQKRGGGAVEMDDEEEEDLGVPVSTDIANTIMDDTAVAELRYLDPFRVEVSGRLPMASLTRRFANQFQAQLNRCGLTLKALAYSSRTTLKNSARYATAYEQWVQEQLQAKRQRALKRTCRNDRIAYLREQTELFDLGAYAVRFAVAAYGLPYELGYFNSVQEMAKLQAEPHRRYTCATSEEQMESMRRMLQGEEPEPLMEFASSRYSLRVAQPCYSVVLDHERRLVVLTFRGSLTMSDAIVDITEGYALVDLLRSGTEPPLAVETDAKNKGNWSALLDEMSSRSRSIESGSGNPVTMKDEGEAALHTRVPLGFYIAVREAAESLLPALESMHAQYPEYSLIVTGHSLGGIEATLFYLLYCFAGSQDVRFETVHAITFGAAPTVEERILASLNLLLEKEKEKTGSSLVSFAYGKDVVTRLQVRSLRSALLDSEEKESVLTAASAPSSELKPLPPRCRGDEIVVPTLAVPGRLMNMPSHLRRSCFDVPEDAKWRKEAILSTVAVYHHFPIHYARSLNGLLTYYAQRLAQAEEA